jgi:hypothetical protein
MFLLNIILWLNYMTLQPRRPHSSCPTSVGRCPLSLRFCMCLFTDAEGARGSMKCACNHCHNKVLQINIDAVEWTTQFFIYIIYKFVGRRNKLCTDLLRIHSAVAFEPYLLTEPLKTTLYSFFHLPLQYILNEEWTLPNDMYVCHSQHATIQEVIWDVMASKKKTL